MSRTHAARPIRLALAFSAVLHLSMVTIFRVVIYFPRYDAEYVSVDIVRADIIRRELSSERLTLSSSDDAFERMTDGAGESLLDPLPSVGIAAETAVADPWAGLPQIELPKLEFKELDRLRFQVRGLEIGKRYDDQFGRTDLWSRFGRQVGSVTDALSSVVRGPRDESDVQHAIEVPSPAPGFAAYVEWLTPPYSREALGGSRIEALWGRDPGTLRESLAIPFRADALGSVIEVLPPLEGEPAVVDDAMAALAEYRFEALGNQAPESQMGTFIVRGAGDQ